MALTVYSPGDVLTASSLNDNLSFAAAASNDNVVINGAMQVAQRGTSTASITTGGYYTADRFLMDITTMGTFTQTVENDAPTGSGFRKSLKMNCTTADASPAAGDLVLVAHRIEGQNLQQFLKGTADAKQFTLSFYVKASETGTYNVELFDNDNTRIVSAAYTVVASNTWEEKTIIFPADTTGAFDNDNANSMSVIWWLGAGSNFTSGTRDTLWGTVVQADRAVGQVNVAGATSRTWQITGVKLEVGGQATPFPFEDISTTLAKCQRYFLRIGGTTFGPLGLASTQSAVAGRVLVPFPVAMRTFPTGITVNGTAPATSTGTFTSLTADRFTTTSAMISLVGTGYTIGGSVFVFGSGDATTSLDFTGVEL